MTQPQDRALELADATIPAPRNIRAELKRQLNQAVLAERQRRGQVHVPEDTYPMHRALARVIETCGEYERAFKDAAKEARAIAQEELIDIVGESDGVPNQGMTVPDAEGDVVISRDMGRVHEFDRDALFAAIAFEVIESLELARQVMKTLGLGPTGRSTEPEGYESDGEELESLLTGALMLAMQRLTECGKFEPQVTKVKTFTTSLARHGADSVAAVVTSSHRIREVFKGLKVERKLDDKPKAQR